MVRALRAVVLGLAVLLSAASIVALAALLTALIIAIIAGVF